MLLSFSFVRFSLVFALSTILSFCLCFMFSQQDLFSTWLYSFSFCLLLMEGGRVLVHKIIARNSSSFYFFSFCFLILSVLLTTIAGSFLDIEKGQNTILFFLDGVVVLITGIFQGVYFWIKKNAKARETLIAKKQIYLQYNFNALKSKNVIEFLQDSLITTIKLIKKDSELTARQIEKLTSILRYLLQSRDEKFVRLGAELKNVVEYCELAEIQLNNTIDLQMNIASKFHETQIPPLVFQMVLDNQFKSFSETGKGLLKIEVYIENAKFIVVKTSQPTKKINAFKNEQFINNLKQRYQLYNKASGVSELSTMSEYFIKFPLLAG